MTDMLLLWQQVANEFATMCLTSTTRDFKTVTSRFEHERESFLTITLPDFGKDFQKSLDLGQIGSSLFPGFQRRGGLPAFLQGFLRLVFDGSTGRLLEEPNIDAIHAIRQLTLMFSKLERRCTPKRERNAMVQYLKCEEEVREFDTHLSDEMKSDFLRVSNLLWGDVLDKLNREVESLRIIPKHGPGATADKRLGNQKFRQSTWPWRLEQVFPSSDNLIPSPRYYQDLDRVDFLDPGAEIPVKVIAVPKTLKTPRIIAMEPVAMQYMQQGLMEVLVQTIEQHDICSRLVGFLDQGPNKDMARLGSRTGNLATLDLSEASDRVSNQLVRTMLHYYTHASEAVDATRSRRAEVPGFGVYRLSKYASMGSALCFPVEAMVFLTVVFIGIEKRLSRPLTRKAVKSFLGKVRVYGDDIVVPTETVSSVVSSLEAFGFRVNTGKSFWTGKFRESCGGDYYDGHDVSVHRVRRDLPARRTDVQEIISTVALRNQLYGAGLWSTARWLDERLKRVMRFYPVVSPESPVLGRHSFLGYETQRECPVLHRPLVKGWRVRSVTPTNKLDGTEALLKWFLKRGELPFASKDHLERSGRPKAVTLSLGWTPPY